MPKWIGSSLNPDDILLREKQWELQWARVQRWMKRVNTIKENYESHELTHYDIDDIISFFQNCYHLRDWILSSKPELQKELIDFFKNNFEMQICHDICNGFKHKNLNRAKVDKDFGILREYDYYIAETDSTKNPIKTNIILEQGQEIKKYCLFELAEICFQLWCNFIKNKNL